MSAKVIVPEAEGYREILLVSMLERTMFPSAFFDQPIRVRGVLFAAGPDSGQLARDFAERHLGLAVLSIGHEAGTEKAWAELSRVLTHQQNAASRLGILLPDLDRVPVEAQEQIHDAVQAANNLAWFPSAADHRKVIPALRLALVTYLGLGSDNKMQIVLQSNQTIGIDEGSLKRAPRPDVN